MGVRVESKSHRGRVLLGTYDRTMPRRARARPLYNTSKRCFDIVFSLLILALSAPLWLTAALLIKRTSPGPILYRHIRMGRNRKPFVCYKFRTMVDGADQILATDVELGEQFRVSWKLRNDYRVTSVGKWLRRSSMDELPQLLNVLRGEMSIVGPRPVQPRELEELFGEFAALVTSVKPGLTSLWGVSGRSLLSYEERIELELEYIERCSFAYDLSLVLRTVPAVITGRGAV